MTVVRVGVCDPELGSEVCSIGLGSWDGIVVMKRVLELGWTWGGGLGTVAGIVSCIHLL